MKHVVDASLLASLVLPDERNEKADKFGEELQKDGAAAPGLLQLEIANILLMAERRKRVTHDEVIRLLEQLEMLPIVLQPNLTADQRKAVVNLAQKHSLTAYDAAYLELSLRFGLPLASLDAPLINAAKAEGVGVAL